MPNDPADTSKSAPEESWPVGWDSHRREQIVFIARNTTPAQRFAWLCDMLELLRPQLPQLLRNRELLETQRRARQVAGRVAPREE